MSEYEEIKRAVREVLLSEEFLKEFAEAFARTETELAREIIPLGGSWSPGWGKMWNDAEPRSEK